MLGRLLNRHDTAERATLGSYDSNTFWSLPGGFGLTAAAYSNAGGIEDALKNAASWACIRVLVDALARTPIQAMRETHGTRELVEPMPKILARPSGIVQPDVWRGQLAFGLTTDGNSFAKVADTDFYGKPTQLELVDGADCTERKVVGGVPQVTFEHRTHQLWPFGDMWHLPGDMVMPGSPFALSPLTYANKTIGTSLAAEDFSYRFFSDGGHPPVSVTSDHELTSAQATDIKQNIQRSTRGNREPIVMGSGLSLNELHLDPHETQFIDLMRFCVEQACRFWGVPPSMIFAAISGQHMTYANVTQADLGFLKQVLEGKFIRMEYAFTDLLPGNNYTAPSVPNTIALCDRNAVLKADVQTRYATHLIGLEGRFKTINEIRAEEGDQPFDDPIFDEPGVPPFALTPDMLGVDTGDGAAPAGGGTQPAAATAATAAKPFKRKPRKPDGSPITPNSGV